MLYVHLNPEPGTIARRQFSDIDPGSPWEQMTEEQFATWLESQSEHKSNDAPATEIAPDWPGFLAELLLSPALGAAQISARQILAAELPTADGTRLERLLRASTALNSLPALLLSAASPGGTPELFIGAWLTLRQANLVSPDVASAMSQLAVAYHLPADLIRSLGAPE